MALPGFTFRDNSAYNDMSVPQVSMMHAIENSGDQNGLVVAPCGSGKSAVILAAAMRAGTMVLILCYESQGVVQIAKDLAKHTTLLPNQICTYTGQKKMTPSYPFCYLVTTYGMFATSEASRTKGSKGDRKFVFETMWDLVCCDEAHHMCADTYKPMVESLNAKRKLGFTATPYRSELLVATEQPAAHVANAFGWFGEVLVRIPWTEVQDAGLGAKIGRARVDVELTPEFRKAYGMAIGPEKKYIAALNPGKLSALVAVCAMHGALNHRGIVFVTHLVTATVTKRVLQHCFGAGWEVLSGGSAHGEYDMHTADQNAAIINRFNNGELRGLICTNVAAGAMDIPDCTFAVDLDTDGGRASAVQRYGRIARTARVHANPGETAPALRLRRLEKQKEAWYYDLVTRGTEDGAAAARRQAFFTEEGYAEEVVITTESLLRAAQAGGATLPCVSLVEQMKLLREVLAYSALKGVCAQANAVVANAKKPHAALVRNLKEKKEDAKNKLMREQKTSQIKKAQARAGTANRQANVERLNAINKAPLDEKACGIFRALRLSTGVLEGAGLIELAFAPSEPSDDERGADDD